jgi:hypothetical protein
MAAMAAIPRHHYSPIDKPSVLMVILGSGSTSRNTAMSAMLLPTRWSDTKKPMAAVLFGCCHVPPQEGFAVMSMNET